MVYVSTQKIGKEMGSKFNGLSGMRHWRKLQKTTPLDAEGVGLIQSFLLSRMSLQLDLVDADDSRQKKKKAGPKDQKPSVLVQPKLPVADLQRFRHWLQQESNAERLVKQFR